MFHHVIGIPVGTNCAPLMTELIRLMTSFFIDLIKQLIKIHRLALKPVEPLEIR